MTGEELAKEFTKYINVMCRDDDEFINIITRQHRTLQQCAFALFMKCVKEWSEQEQCDARNEHTIKMCKEIMKIENIEYVPFI